MLVATTPQMKGKKIFRSNGLVSGNAFLGSTAAGADLDCETIPIGQGNMLRVSASGTAVFDEGE